MPVLSLESCNSDGKTAIFLAAEKGYESVFNYLLSKGAKISGVSHQYNENILMAAILSDNWNIFTSLLNRKETDIKHRNKAGKTALYYVREKPPQWAQKIMAECPENERVNLIKTPNNDHTIWHSSSRNIDSLGNLKIILQTLSEEQRDVIADIKDMYGNTMFHFLANKDPHFAAALEFYPQEQRLSLLQKTNQNKQTALHCAASCLASLKVVFALVLEENKWEEITRADEDGNTLLHCAAYYPECLKEILDHLSPDQRVAALGLLNKNGYTALYCATICVESLQHLFKVYSPEQGIEAIELRINRGINALGLAQHVDSLHYLLQIYSKKQGLTASDLMSSVDREGNTILHKAVAETDLKLLQATLNLIPEEERFNAVQITNNDRKTPLHLASTPEILFALITLYPEDQRLGLAVSCCATLHMFIALIPEDQKLNAFKAQNKQGDTLLHLADFNSDSMKFILESYPEDQRLNALLVTNQSGIMMLDRVAKSDKLFALIPPADRIKALKILADRNELQFEYCSNRQEQILTLIPQEQQLEALSLFCCPSGARGLHGVPFVDQIKRILIILPESLRPNAIRLKDAQGKTILHKNARRSEFLSDMLLSVPEELREDLLLDRDNGGNTVLHLVANDYQGLLKIMPFISEDRVLDLLSQMNHQGKTVLHVGAEDPKSCRILLSRIPQDQRLICLSKVENSSNSVLNDAVPYPECIQVIWELLSERQKMSLLDMSDDHGATLMYEALFHALSHPESLKILLGFLPEDQRIIWMQKVDDSCVSIWLSASSESESIKVLLELYPEDQRDKILNKATKTGLNGLSFIARHPESLKVALPLIAKEKRFAAVKTIDNKTGDSVLHWAVTDLESLQQVLVLYPEDELLGAIYLANEKGKTVMQRAEQYPESLAFLKDVILKISRKEVIEVGTNGYSFFDKPPGAPPSVSAVCDNDLVFFLD